MIDSKFKKIALAENGQYDKNETTVSLFDSSRCPEIHYRVYFNYEDCFIDIQIKTGLVNAARAEIRLSPNITPVKFEINSIDHFTNLFLRKKSRFKVKCKNKKFKNFLENKGLCSFNQIMESQNFDPTFFTQKTDSTNKIVTEFSIIFQDWINVFEELITFFKLLINELKAID